MLQTYRTKRRFDVTREPRGKRGRTGGNSFVIQKHAARRLHYDLRLELDGVMKSWAVTRGPSLVPGEKRLAVHVEDHPIEYNKFEGTIPKGEYGGGAVMIWDRGHWFAEGDPHAGYRKGHLSFRLEGEKLNGVWHLVRMRKKPGDRQEPWLLIKSDDESARTVRDPDILEEEPLSVTTGRTMDEITQGKRSVRSRAPAVKPRRSAARQPRSGTRKARDGAEKEDGSARGRKQALPDFVAPCLAVLKDAAPDDPDYVHEIKFDGYRIEARLDRGKVALKTRKNLDWTDRFPPIAEAVAQLPAKSALIDGEIVSLTQKGHADFSQLQQDLKSGRTDRFAYCVFDLLHLDGRDLTDLPLVERKDALRQLLARAPDVPIAYSEHSDESGSLMHEHACRLGLEGIVSKRKDAPYRSGRQGDWIKTKCANRQEFVIAGYVLSTVDPRAIGALILSYYENGRLTYAGRTGTGFSRETARDLWKRLQPLRATRTPFAKVPDEERSRDAQWVEPKLVAEVDFHGWTHGERVRQASFQGLREDKPASEIVREKAMPATEPESKSAPKQRSPAPRTRANATVGGIALTNPDRVYWKDAGITKRDLANYYAEIWDWIAPHLVRRPISLVRCPEGSSSECFFQRHASAGLDPSHLLPAPEQGGKPVLAIGDLDGLISLVQAGALELHVWGTTIEHLDACDRLVFDLDPGPGVEWPVMIEAAREVRSRMQALGLTSFLKTTGGKGLHVVVPIVSTSWDIAKPFARALAFAMAADSPSRFLATASKQARHGRIFVDYLRNDRTASSIVAYSTRARPGATISTPITWEELGRTPGPNQYTLRNLPARLSRLRKDPWAEISKLRQRLPSAETSAGKRKRPAASGRPSAKTAKRKRA